MTTMVAELYDALKAAGSPDDKAIEAAKALAEPNAKLDSIDKRTLRIQEDMARMQADMVRMQADMARMQAEIVSLREDFARMQDSLVNMKMDLTRVQAELAMIKWLVGGTFLGVATLAIRSFWLGV